MNTRKRLPSFALCAAAVLSAAYFNFTPARVGFDPQPDPPAAR